MSDLWNPDLYKNDHSFVFKFGEDLIKLLNPNMNDNVLDIGCGTGELTYEISKLVKSITGIDSSSKMLESSRKNYPDVNFEVVNALEMNFHNEFDKVFSNAVFHWILDQETFLKNIYNSLKTNGKLVAEMGGKDNVEIIFSNFKNSLIKRGYQKNADKKVNFFPSVAEYTSLLEKSGFTVRYVLYFDRDTELSDENGIKNFLTMFYESYFDNVTEKDKADILEEVQNECKKKLYKNNKWYADYKRLRFIAEKK